MYTEKEKYTVEISEQQKQDNKSNSAMIITYTDKSTRVSLDLIRRPSQMHVDS